jgi:hypothetical protein
MPHLRTLRGGALTRGAPRPCEWKDPRGGGRDHRIDGAGRMRVNRPPDRTSMAQPPDESPSTPDPSPSAERPALALNCLEGQPPPPAILADARIAAALPRPVRERFWEVLGRCLGDPLPDDLDARLDRFVAEVRVDGDALARAIKACRFLIRTASLGDVAPRAFADDLVALAGGAPDLANLLMPGYERAKAQVRSDAVLRTVLDHGRVLEKINWRIDLLASSDRGHNLRLPVVTLTLHYREGTRRDQLTLQVLPDLVGELRAICNRVLR